MDVTVYFDCTLHDFIQLFIVGHVKETIHLGLLSAFSCRCDTVGFTVLFRYGNADCGRKFKRAFRYDTDYEGKGSDQAAAGASRRKFARCDSTVSGFGLWRPKGAGAFGAGWQSAATANRIVELNQAVEDGNYLYLFDRALEMGNDTVLIQISMMKNKSWDVDYATECAARLGYEKIEENDGYVLYHMAVDGTFGIRTQYDAIGIGSSAKVLSFLYPDMEETDSANLDDYSFEELSAYKVVYLDHFTYTDKTAAEELVRKLSENGTKVVISADGIPTNERLKVQEFLGVSCSSILFENGYPILSVGEKN